MAKLLDQEPVDAFLQTDEFAVDVTWHRSPGLGGGDVVIPGQFEEAFVELQAGGEIAAEGSQPRFTTADSYIVGMEATEVAGDRVTVKGKAWDIVSIEPDGTGFSLVVLGTLGA